MGRSRGYVITIEEVLLILLVLSLGYLGGILSTYHLSDLGEKTVYNPSYNLSCPEPVRNVRLTSTVSNSREYSDVGDYIQAAYTDVDYSFENGRIKIPASDISKPEGKSMRPTIFSGNTLILQEYGGGRISEGEILRYSTGDGYVVHRVQANYLDTGGYLLMKGDNNEYSSRINKSQVTHRVAGVLYTPPGFDKSTAFKD
ncbi:MAG: S24/S26 family peptidase [Candidatus Nanosalina sp.]